MMPMVIQWSCGCLVTSLSGSDVPQVLVQEKLCKVSNRCNRRQRNPCVLCTLMYIVWSYMIHACVSLCTNVYKCIHTVCIHMCDLWLMYTTLRLNNWAASVLTTYIHRWCEQLTELSWALLSLSDILWSSPWSNSCLRVGYGCFMMTIMTSLIYPKSHCKEFGFLP